MKKRKDAQLFVNLSEYWACYTFIDNGDAWKSEICNEQTLQKQNRKVQARLMVDFAMSSQIFLTKAPPPPK